MKAATWQHRLRHALVCLVFSLAAQTALARTADAPAPAAEALPEPSLPAGLPPHVQFGIENKIDFVDRLSTLPGHDTLEDADAAPYLNDVVSYQHPDHDTDVWPPLEKPS